MTKNDAFPIHANILDSEVDMDEEKPGGFFTKKLYADDNNALATESSVDKDSDEDDDYD